MKSSLFSTILLSLFIFNYAFSITIKPPKETALERFLRYVKIDTQSKDDVETVPSTEKQRNLATLLAKELKKLNVQNVRLSEYGFVYAIIPGNLPDNTSVPAIGFMAHMDTSPAVSGENVHPLIHKNYQGGNIILPKDSTQIISPEKNPLLNEMHDDDIITADGSTLLGSDDKAGCAEIMTLADILQENPEIAHGTIAIAFTPDEETGNGIAKFDIENFGAQYAYTVDGGELGEISDETWSARQAFVTLQGRSTHPGDAKGIMLNSAYALADFLLRFPNDKLPETTEGRIGFIHPYDGKVDVEQSSIKILIRDFDESQLDEKENLIRAMASETQKKYPDIKINIAFEKQYQNMKEILKNYSFLTDYAIEASHRAGVEAKLKPSRGGTDGSDLTFRGLPCPNLYTGGHNFHGKLEFNSRRGLEKSTEMLLHLVQIFVEKSQTKK